MKTLDPKLFWRTGEGRTDRNMKTTSGNEKNKTGRYDIVMYSGWFVK